MTLAHDAGPTDIPLIHQTIGENLAATVARYPEGEALVVPYQGVRLTYGDFAIEVDRVAGLAGIEIGPSPPRRGPYSQPPPVNAVELGRN